MSVPEIHAAIGPCRLNSRAAELRARGVQIVCVRLPGVSGPEAYVYRIVGSEECCNTAPATLGGEGRVPANAGAPAPSPEQPPALVPSGLPDGGCSPRSASAVGESAVSSAAPPFLRVGELERADAEQLSLLVAA